MSLVRVLGVDPGLDGALALLEVDTAAPFRPRLVIHDMPTAQVDKSGRSQAREVMETGVADIVRTLRPDIAFVELVHSMPAQGVVSCFTFGLGFGVVRGVLAGLGIRCELVGPQRWGRLVQLPRGDGGSRARAAQLFPASAGSFVPKGAHGRADAALIALAGFRSAPF